MWLRRGSNKYAIMSLVDSATRYTAASLIHSEHTDNYVKALECTWVAHFGPPGTLITDEGRGWLSTQMDEWTAAHQIKHNVAPANALRSWSGGMLSFEAVEVYLNDLKLDGSAGIQQALTYVVPQLNSMPGVAGFSPSQWVLGYQPSLAGDLLSDATQPAHFGGNQTFEEMLTKRHAARKALNDADADRRLRRALHLKYKGTNSEYALGQHVWFWRDARQPDLVKIRWLGPAQVAMKERRATTEGSDGPVSVYWLAFKTQLIRCAPHHVRADVKSFNHAIEDTQTALNTVRQLKSRGVTRFYDLHRVNRQNLADVEDDEHGEGTHLDTESEREMAPPRQRPRLTMDLHLRHSRLNQQRQIRHQPRPRLQLHRNQARLQRHPHRHRRYQAMMMIFQSQAKNLARNLQQHRQHHQHRLGRLRTRSWILLTAALYESQPAETFQQQRLRFNSQETLSFAPFRHRRHQVQLPYPATEGSESAAPAAPPLPAPEQLDGQAFYIENLDTTSLPSGWRMDEQGYLQLSDRISDY